MHFPFTFILSTKKGSTRPIARHEISNPASVWLYRWTSWWHTSIPFSLSLRQSSSLLTLKRVDLLNLPFFSSQSPTRIQCSLPIGFTRFTRISALRTEILQGRFLEVEYDCEDWDCHPTLLAFLFDDHWCVSILSLVANSNVEIVWTVNAVPIDSKTAMAFAQSKHMGCGRLCGSVRLLIPYNCARVLICLLPETSST